MPVDAPLFRDPTSGRVQEKAAVVAGGTAGQDGRLVALDSTGRLDSTVLPVGVGADTYSGTAFEGLTAGAFVHVRSDGTVALASAASTGADADGFVLAASSAGQPALVYFEGRNTGRTGLTVGTRYYLSDTSAGSVTATPVSGTGKRHQYLGKAVTTTTLATELADGIVLA